MEHVYYTLVGILAMAGIGLLAVAIFKLVMFLGDTIDDWWHDRKVRKITQQPQIVWAKDGSTGRIVTDKPITPNQLRALQGLSPFHKHNYRLKRATATHYGFMCDGHTWNWGQKVACEHWRDISKKDFWKGEKTEWQ